MPELDTIYSYMRAWSDALGQRILDEYPALHRFKDPLSSRIETLLRQPFPAQSIAIMGIAKRWQEARTANVVAECGTGKTLISLGAILPAKRLALASVCAVALDWIWVLVVSSAS
jgi:superfamily II DNA or RNA helicase